MNGEAATVSWNVGPNPDTAVFSAGMDAVNAYSVFGSGTSGAPGSFAGGVVIEDGLVIFSGGTLGLGAGFVTIKAGAALSTDSSLRISSTAGSVWTLDGGTAISTNGSPAGSFIDIDSTITLTAAGGTISHTATGVLNIVQTATVISGPGFLTKTGPGVIAIASPSTYLGATTITDGELRIRTTANRLPIATPLTVDSPGILNLNGVGQQIGSLSGTGLVGLGNATLTVGNATDTIFSGSIRDTANAGASGTAALRGNVTKVGSGVQTFAGANTYTGATTINGGTLKMGDAAALSFGGLQTTSTGATTVSSGATLDLNGNSGINEPITLSGTGIGGIGALINSSATPAIIANGVAGLSTPATGTGSGYSAAPLITINGTGTGATATAFLGVTKDSFVIDGGTTTYSVAPTVTITGFGATGATATAILTGGAVTGINITNAGTNFIAAPNLTFGTGTVLVAGTNPSLISTNADSFTVSGMQMTSAGSGYTGTPTFSFDSGNATTVTPTLSSITLAADSSIGGSGDITINAVVSQSGIGRALTKVGAGTLTLAAANTYSGATTVNGGTVKLGHAAGLGFGGIQTTLTGTTVVNSGFTLDLNGVATLQEPLILNGTGIGANGALINNSGATTTIGNGIAGLQLPAATTGSGYSTTPAVNISGTGSGAAATATLGVTAASFTLNLGDKFYTVAPTVTISGGSGTGATATAVLSGGTTGTLTGITITNAGRGFTTAPTIVFGAGTFSSGTVSGSGTGNATQFTVSGLSVTAAGTGYTGTPTYSFASGNATPGTVTLSSVVLATNSSIGGTGNIVINSTVSESGGARTLTKVGTGKLELNGLQNYTTLNTQSGRTDLNNILGTGTSIINADAQTNITVSETLAALNIGAGAVVTLGNPPPSAPESFAEALLDFGDGANPVQAVPEPGSAALLVSGALGLLLRRRRVG